MHGPTKQTAVLLLVIGLGFVFGRLAVRGFMNVLIGGTMFGGDFL